MTITLLDKDLPIHHSLTRSLWRQDPHRTVAELIVRLETNMHLLQALSDKGILFMLRRNVVAEVHGIRLVSFRDHSEFIPILTHALELIRDLDQLRFNRVQTHIAWIFDHSHWGGAGCASYLPRIKACCIDFEFVPDLGDALTNAADYAGLIVHEATHGVVEAHQIQTTEHNRARIERLCYTEQNRFLKKLNGERPGLGDSLVVSYDPQVYEASWKTGRLRKFIAEIRRAKEREMPSTQRNEDNPE